MALSAIFASVKEEFDAILSGVEWRDGGEHLGANDSPPRVVWVPTEDAYSASEIHGDSTYPLATSPRPLLQCDATVEVHLWGRERDETEQIRDAFVASLRRAAGAAFKVTRGFWPVQDAKALVQQGRVYVLTISFPIPILDVVQPLATVTTTAQDIALEPVP
jgi:hypothetical protein